MGSGARDGRDEVCALSCRQNSAERQLFSPPAIAPCGWHLRAGYFNSSAASAGAFGEGIERGEYFWRTPHSVAGSVSGLDEDSRFGERVEIAVSIGRLDGEFLRH